MLHIDLDAFFAGNTQLGRPLLLPPDVPADRVAALRLAFDATMTDAAFLKDAETMGFEVTPQTGEQIATLVAASLATPEQKNRALDAMERAIRANAAAILAANAEDVADARAGGATTAFIDRLTLTQARVDAIARP